MPAVDGSCQSVDGSCHAGFVGVVAVQPVAVYCPVCTSQRVDQLHVLLLLLLLLHMTCFIATSSSYKARGLKHLLQSFLCALLMFLGPHVAVV